MGRFGNPAPCELAVQLGVCDEPTHGLGSRGTFPLKIRLFPNPSVTGDDLVTMGT